MRQPWAYAITHCGKRVENRTWAPPHRLPKLLIHAGQGIDLGDAAPTFTRLRLALPTPEQLTVGAIVAVAQVTRWCPPDRRCTCDPWAAPGQVHWHLHALRLREPVACRGARRLWQPPADVLDKVTGQLPGWYLDAVDRG